MKALTIYLALLGLFLLSAGSPAQDKKPDKPPVVKEEERQPAGSLGYKPLTPERRAYFQAQSLARHGNKMTLAAKNLALPSSFDGMTKVPLATWDQGQCGSCYLDSTVWAMTYAGCLVGLGKADGSFLMSAQYGMDRPRDFGGCNGGNGTEVIDWAVKHGWIAERYIDSAGTAHNDYPAYQANSGSDRTKPGAKVWVKGWDWGFVNPNTKTFVSATGSLHFSAPPVEEVKAAIYLHGNVNIALDAGGQFGNGTTTITQLGTYINHEINLDGYDDNEVNPDGSKGVFFLKNQWGNSWGVKGRRKITYNAAKRLVDHFFINAGTVPPDPIPPGPTPPNGGPVKQIIVTFADGSTQTLVAGGGGGLTLKTTIEDIVEMFQKKPSTDEPPLAKPLSKLDALERDMADMKKAINSILDALMPPKKEPVKQSMRELLKEVEAGIDRAILANDRYLTLLKGSVKHENMVCRCGPGCSCDPFACTCPGFDEPRQAIGKSDGGKHQGPRGGPDRIEVAQGRDYGFARRMQDRSCCDVKPAKAHDFRWSSLVLGR